MRNRLIIINRMYAGKYLTEGENIGHEVINLIRSDNGNNYLWLNADGNCDISKLIDKKGNCRYDDIIMIMVRMYGPGKWKVLAKAELDIPSLADYMVPAYGKKFHEQQKRIIEQEHITYGNQPLHKIFGNNYFNGQLQSGIDIYFTFKAKAVLLPVFDPKNLEKTIVAIAGMKGLARQSLRMYLTNEKNVETYALFDQIIDGKLFDWETANTTQAVSPDYVTATQKQDYLLRIINEEYRELTFSNLLAYFLKNKHIMQGFAKEVLLIDDFDAENYSIAREEKNIDLFISSPTHYIIIENKIRSGLIRETQPMEKKLCEYFNVATAAELPPQGNALLCAFQSAPHHYQTDRYFAYANGVTHQHRQDAAIKGYVLFPNYSEHSIAEQMKDTLFSDHYAPITYRRVYTYFCSLTGANFLSESQSKYLDEFLLAMEKHTKDVDNTFEEEMTERFYRRIQHSRNG